MAKTNKCDSRDDVAQDFIVNLDSNGATRIDCGKRQSITSSRFRVDSQSTVPNPDQESLPLGVERR